MSRRAGWRTRGATEGAFEFPAFAVLAGLSLVLFLCLGGGTRSGLISDVVAQAGAIPLLLWGLWRLASGHAASIPKIGLLFVAVLVLFPIAQILPVWPSSALPGSARALEQDVRGIVGADGGRSTLSVAPEATLLAAISLLPPLALFVAALVLPASQRRWLAYILIGFSFVSVILGLLQLSQGPSSPLRFYAITNSGDAVGFFANRNHFAALLNCALVLASACLLFAASETGAAALGRSWRQVTLIAGFTLIVSLLAGEIMSRSRAGVGLAAVATALSCAMIVGVATPAKARARPLTFLALTIGLGVVIAIQYGAYRLVERFNVDPLQDARKTFAQNTYDAITAYLPFGSGLGTFTHVYPAFEQLNSVLVGTYVNRAHNDVVEYALELGAVGGLLHVLATLYFGSKSLALWRPGRRVTLDLLLQRAASAVLLLLLLHSVFDYPLRSGAMLVVLALSAAFVMSPSPAEDASATVSVAPPRGGQKSAKASKSTPVQAVEPADAQPNSPAPVRAAWGQDVAWPEAWKSNGKKPGD